MGLAESRALDEQEEHLQPGPLGLGGGAEQADGLGALAMQLCALSASSGPRLGVPW